MLTSYICIGCVKNEEFEVTDMDTKILRADNNRRLCESFEGQHWQRDHIRLRY